MAALNCDFKKGVGCFWHKQIWPKQQHSEKRPFLAIKKKRRLFLYADIIYVTTV